MHPLLLFLLSAPCRRHCFEDSISHLCHSLRTAHKYYVSDAHLTFVLLFSASRTLSSRSIPCMGSLFTWYGGKVGSRRRKSRKICDIRHDHNQQSTLVSSCSIHSFTGYHLSPTPLVWNSPWRIRLSGYALHANFSMGTFTVCVALFLNADNWKPSTGDKQCEDGRRRSQTPR